MSEEIKEFTGELTLTQKIALEAEVSMCYELALHAEDTKYYSYILLIGTQPEYRQLFKTEMLYYTDEETLNSCMRYVNLKMFPTTYLVNKILSDIKLFTGLIESIKDRVHTVPKAIMKSKFVSFIRDVAEEMPYTAREVLTEVLEDDQLEFLHNVAFCLLKEIPNEKDKLDDDMEIAKFFNNQRIVECRPLSFHSEMEQNSNASAEDLEDKIEGILNNLLKSKETKKYYVVKIDKATKMEAMRKAFNTQEEAIAYCKGVEKDYKELLQRYDFKVVSE